MQVQDDVPASPTPFPDEPATAGQSAATPAEVAEGSVGARLRRHLARAGVALLGGVIVLVGLLLVPLPGPGWPVVFVGLSLLGRQFPWAARLSTWAQRRVREAVRWFRRGGRPASATSGARGRSAEAVAVGR